jgi:hypothetical protein
MTGANDLFPTRLHVYEGTGSDSDEYVTSGRAFREVKEKEMQAISQSSQYDVRRQALVRSNAEPEVVARHPEGQYTYHLRFCICD